MCVSLSRILRWYNTIMPLSEKEVQQIAHLARLTLDQAEIARYQEQLSAILDHIKMLGELDTSDIPATSSVLPMNAPLRADQPRRGISTSEALKNAPFQEQDQFKVPPVLDES